MKSAYELAMERLDKSSPTKKVSEKQKKQMAELDSLYAAKVAEREISIKGDISKAMGEGDFDSINQLQQRLTEDRKKFAAELEEKKEAIRSDRK